MDCSNVANLLDAYLDRELDREDTARVREHLDICGQCSRTLAARSAASAAIKRDAVYHAAPQALANRIRAQVAQETGPRAVQSRESRLQLANWIRWLPLGSAFATVVAATALVTLQLARAPEDETLVAQLLTGHSRAIITGHGIDVASSDQHTVKPWLSSRLDFSPHVVDLSRSGFPLRGGRLDYVGNRPVAVLIYARGQHGIDLFIWPEGVRPDTNPGRAFSKRGLNVVHWTAAGMAYWAVSDVNEADLEVFAKAYESAR